MTITPISPLDGAFLLVERPSTPAHGSALLEFTKPADAPPDYLQRMVEQWRGSPLAPPYDLRPVKAGPLGYRLPVMRAVTDYDFDFHVRPVTLPEPGGERELGEYVSAQHSTPMDLSRPLWELHVIDGLADNRFALYAKVHHAIMDGTTLMRRLRVFTSEDSGERDMRPLFSVGPAARAGRPPASSRPSVGSRVQYLGTPLRVVGELARLVRQNRVGSLDGEPLAAPYRQNKDLFRGDITNERRISTYQAPLADMTALAKAAEATVNDIVLWLVGTALRTYLTEQDMLPADPPTAGCPVNLRDADDDRPGNILGLITVDLGCLVTDPRQRLEAIKRSSRTSKRQLGALSPQARAMQGLVVVAPTMGAIALGLGARTPAAYNVLVSNLPGFTEQRFYSGARLELIAGATVIAPNSPLAVACCSHGDRFTFSVHAATATVPHSQRIATALGQAFDQLRALLLPASS